jgi:hypothetical protein
MDIDVEKITYIDITFIILFIVTIIGYLVTAHNENNFIDAILLLQKETIHLQKQLILSQKEIIDLKEQMRVVYSNIQ